MNFQMLILMITDIQTENKYCLMLNLLTLGKGLVFNTSKTDRIYALLEHQDWMKLMFVVNK